jgi:hypothetical protein
VIEIDELFLLAKKFSSPYSYRRARIEDLFRNSLTEGISNDSKSEPLTLLSDPRRTVS